MPPYLGEEYHRDRWRDRGESSIEVEPILISLVWQFSALLFSLFWFLETLVVYRNSILSQNLSV